MTTEINLPRHVALYREVCRQPECDTLRLAYADALDEAGDHDRAEFIRLQCELARLLGKWPGTETFTDEGIRANQLRDAHPEWRKCPCPACGGANRTFDACACGGSGDLFHRVRASGAGGRTIEERAVTFARGFPDSVECTAADVWREEREESRNMDGDGWATRTVPTEWAKAVVRATPVRIFTVGDLEPWDFGGTDRQRGWWREGGAQVRNHATIHGPIYDLIAPEMMLFGAKAFRTEAAARSALGLATGLWVRAAAYPAVPVG